MAKLNVFMAVWIAAMALTLAPIAAHADGPGLGGGYRTVLADGPGLGGGY